MIRLAAGLALALAFVPAPPASAQSDAAGEVIVTPLDVQEAFALADDRAAVLERLLPGSEEHFFRRALLLQHEGRLDELPALLASWRERHGRTWLWERVHLRQMLLRHAVAPEAAFAELREELGLRFDARPELPGRSPDLPVRLDPAVVSREAVLERALAELPASLGRLREDALVALLERDLDDAALREVLRRLTHADVPGLPELVVRELRSRDAEPFGGLRVHFELLLHELEACARLMPELLAQQTFVSVWAERLAPPHGVDALRDRVARRAWLERLLEFAERLPPVHRTLEAQALHALLELDLREGRFDRERLLRYLGLPRAHPLRPRSHGVEVPLEAGRVDTRSAYADGLDALGDDEPLLRACFEQLFRTEESWEPYARYLHADWLRRVFAETKILYGIGDAQRWSALLPDPAARAELERRVEIAFAPTQREHFAAGEPVTLALDLKNVPVLLVEVHEIDAFTVHTETGDQVDAGIDLEGLVPHHTERLELDASPLRRVRRMLELPSLQRPGTYVVDVLGNGHASRALIRKGSLSFTDEVTAAGHLLRVYDEQGRHLPDASAWLDGREFTADDEGRVLVPFTTDGRMRDLVLRHGRVSTLTRFSHREEDLSLRAGVHVPRESLVPGAEALLLVRPELRVAGRRVGLARLEEPRLQLTAVSHAGVRSTSEVRDLELRDDAELAHAIPVPDDLATLEVVLTARVRRLSTAEDVTLTSAPARFEVGAIVPTHAFAMPLLLRSAAGWVLELRGRSGEPLADRALTLDLTHGLDDRPFVTACKTDAAGRVQLGALDGIVRLALRDGPAGYDVWDLASTAPRRSAGALRGRAGDTLRVPLVEPVALERGAVSFVELRGGMSALDRFEHLALDGSVLELRDLPAGEYRLALRRWEEPARGVVVLDGPEHAGHVLGAHQIARVDGRAPLHLAALDVEGDALVARLEHAGPDTRVHVWGTRWEPCFDAAGALAVDVPGSGLGTRTHAPSSFHEGRTLSDEQRYILDRRMARIFPGNMLRRPSLLLNPRPLWEVDTETILGGASAGFGRGSGKLGSRGGASLRGDSGRGVAPTGELMARHPGRYADLAFLPHAARVRANLRPDADGVLRVPLADFPGAAQLRVLAVDGAELVSGVLALPEPALEPRDTSLVRALPPDAHVLQQRRLEALAAGEVARVREPASSRARLHDSLDDVFELFRGLSDDPHLDDFAELLRWTELSREERLAYDSEHACHELHVFLHEKDPDFFAEVVRPFLAHKLHKTFLDHWLLDADLSRYREPAAYARLNVVERILLARRLGGDEPARTARSVAEAVELAPLPAAEEQAHFEALLRGGALSAATADPFAEDAWGRTPDADPGGDAADEPRAASPGPASGGGARDDSHARAGLALEEPARERAFWRDPDAPRAWVEHHYWKRPLAEQDAELVTPDAFWLDFARTAPDAPFVSPHVARAAGNVAEMMLALAFLDLPFRAAEHARLGPDAAGDGADGADPAGAAVRLAGPALLVVEELGAVTPAADPAPILVSQELLRLDGDARPGAGPEPLGDELARHVPYATRTVLGNPSARARRVELLLQIPAGAVPLAGARATRGLRVELGAWETRSIEHAFYFARAGASTLFPAHVAEDGALLAAAEGRRLEVLDAPRAADTTSWEHVSQAGTLAEVLAFLESANPQGLDLTRLAWRLRDREAFDALLDALRARHVFVPELWSWGLYHGDTRTAREYLVQRDDVVARVGPWLDTALLRVDPVERRSYQHVEFEPLHLGRAHPLGGRPRLPVPALDAQYHALLEILAHKPALDDEDWLEVSWYLLAQDRVAEGLAAFQRVDRDAVDARLPYDYARAWLAFSTEDLATARELVERWSELPVPHWRRRFEQVRAQLDEIAGGDAAVVDPDDRDQLQTARASAGPELAFSVEGPRVRVFHAGLASVAVNYYLMDVEALFSASPFVARDTGAFAVIRPNRAERVPLDDDGETLFELPEELQRAHVLVELRAGELVEREPSFANRLAVQVHADQGQLQVRAAGSGEPLPRVYVKVYAEGEDGDVRFHKDGYTDLRGRFDHASLSADGVSRPRRFAILVLSSEHGAEIREVAAPAR